MAGIVERLEPFMEVRGGLHWHKTAEGKQPCLRFYEDSLARHLGSRPALKETLLACRSVGLRLGGPYSDGRMRLHGDLGALPWVRRVNRKEATDPRFDSPVLRDTSDGAVHITKVELRHEEPILEIELDGDAREGILTDEFVGVFP